MPDKRKIAFLGSKPVGFRSLQFLYDKSDEFGIEIAGVFTNNNPVFGSQYDLISFSKDKGIPIYEHIDQLSEIEDLDYIISIQYHKILQKRHIDCAKELAINLHMAPLPEYRGCNQFSFSLINGDKEFGTTIHRLEEGIDSGDIIAERRFPVPDHCFVKELYDITVKESIELFEETIPNIFNKTYTLTPQDELIDERGCSLHFRKEIHDLKIIDLDWDEEKIDRYVRATYMPGYEPPYALVNEKKIHFTISEQGRVSFDDDDPGKVIIQKISIREVKFGKNVRVVQPVNIYDCQVGDNTFIGPFVEIQKNVSIGKNCKVQSHAFICELVDIGDNCFISHGVMFINDLFSGGGPAGGDRSKWKSTKIGNNVSLGSNSTILPVDICDDVVIGAGSVVTKNITEPGIYAGNPAKKLR